MLICLKYVFIIGNSYFIAETCSNVECPAGKRCKMRSNGRPRCVCAPDCSATGIRHRGPICGTDERTYRNHCAMLKYNCRHSANVDINYFGRCQSKLELFISSLHLSICTHNKVLTLYEHVSVYFYRQDSSELIRAKPVGPVGIWRYL